MWESAGPKRSRQNFKGRDDMKKISLLLIGGMKQDKSEKVSNTLKEGLLKKGLEADIKYANIFETSDLTEYEECCELAVHASPGTVKTKLPVVQGLALLYPWMGVDKLFDDIFKTINDNKEGDQNG